MPSIEGLAIDYDGVLGDTVAAHTQARELALTRMYEASGDECYAHVDPALIREAYRHGSTPAHIIGWLLGQIGTVPQDTDVLTNPIVQEAVRIKNDIYAEIAANGLDAISGALDFMQWAVTTFGSQRLALVTAARKVEVVPFLQRHKLLGSFAAMVTLDDTPIGQAKPDPWAYQEAARQLGYSPEQIAAVEDSPRGLQAAQRFHRIGVATTHSLEDLAPHADIVLGDMSGVRPHLEGLMRA